MKKLVIFTAIQVLSLLTILPEIALTQDFTLEEYFAVPVNPSEGGCSATTNNGCSCYGDTCHKNNHGRKATCASDKGTTICEDSAGGDCFCDTKKEPPKEGNSGSNSW